MIGALVLSFLVVTLIVGVDDVSTFLRLNSSNLDNISSGRWQGITGMLELFIRSPIFGMGFGAADNNFPVYPSIYFLLLFP